MFPIDYTITFSIGAIVGFCVRMVIEDKIIRKRDKDKIYTLAYNDFSKEFTSALHHLDDPSKSSYVIIAVELPRHKEALLNFEHIIRGTKGESRFKAKWHEYQQYCEDTTDHGYSIFLGKDYGPPSVGILEGTVFADGSTEFEKDKPNKEELKRLIHELLKAAKK